MIDQNTIQDAIYAIVQPILNCPTIFTEQNAPRPSTRPYATIAIEGTNQQGGEEYEAPNSVTGVANLWGHYTLTVLFTAYGTGAKNAISRLQFAFNKQTVIDAFDAAGLAVVGYDNVLDIPSIRDTIWEESSRFTATFHIRIADSDNVGVIETITVEGDLQGDVGNTTPDLSLSVTITPP